MRTSFVLALIISFACANAHLHLRRDAHIIPEDDANLGSLTGNKKDLENYFDGIWNFFKLNQSDASACFDTVTAAAYWQYLNTAYSLSQAFTVANHSAVRLYGMQYEQLNRSLALTFQCVYQSKSYIQLMSALGIPSNNRTFLNFMDELYFDAHFNDWYLAFTPVSGLINKTQFYTAGSTYGPVIQAMARNASRYTAFYDVYKGFNNGIFFHNNLTAPYNLSTCTNQTSANPEVEFYWTWAETVANTTAANASIATDAFFAGRGAFLQTQIKPISNCEETTQDLQRLNKKLGVDVYSTAYYTKMMAWIHNSTNAQNYWNMFTNIAHCFRNVDSFCSGNIFGQFYLHVLGQL